MHREYLKEHRPIRFNDLVLSGQLWTYLADLNEQAQSLFQNGFKLGARMMVGAMEE